MCVRKRSYLYSKLYQRSGILTHEKRKLTFIPLSVFYPLIRILSPHPCFIPSSVFYPPPPIRILSLHPCFIPVSVPSVYPCFIPTRFYCHFKLVLHRKFRKFVSNIYIPYLENWAVNSKRSSFIRYFLDICHFFLYRYRYFPNSSNHNNINIE